MDSLRFDRERSAKYDCCSCAAAMPAAWSGHLDKKIVDCLPNISRGPKPERGILRLLHSKHPARCRRLTSLRVFEFVRLNPALLAWSVRHGRLNGCLVKIFRRRGYTKPTSAFRKSLPAVCDVYRTATMLATMYIIPAHAASQAYLQFVFIN